MGFDFNKIKNIDIKKVERFNFLESKVKSTKNTCDEIMSSMSDKLSKGIKSPNRKISCDVNLDKIKDIVGGSGLDKIKDIVGEEKLKKVNDTIGVADNIDSFLCLDLMDKLRGLLLDVGDIDLFAGLDNISLLLGKSDFFNMLLELKGLDLDFNLCGDSDIKDMLNGKNLNLPFEPSDLSININKLPNVFAKKGALALNNRYSSYRSCIKDVGQSLPIDVSFKIDPPKSSFSFL